LAFGSMTSFFELKVRFSRKRQDGSASNSFSGFRRKHLFITTRSTSFLRDHFVADRFGVIHFVVGPFWSRPFLREFHENNFFSFLFSFSNFSILIYKNFFRLFYLFFLKQLMIFCLFLINFFPLYIKKYKLKHTAIVFFSVISVTHKINS